jgi:hypothetical protein
LSEFFLCLEDTLNPFVLLAFFFFFLHPLWPQYSPYLIRTFISISRSVLAILEVLI